MRWTESQQQAISAPRPGNLESQTLLVAAAAGSGKTAVLVERIMQRLQDKQLPIAINELLVLTFTKAAAAEMKGRIGAKLASVYNETHDQYLEQQLNLLPSAQISTLHAFCQWVIRNYFYELDMDPTMRVGNEGQIGLLRADVLDELFEELYETGDYNIMDLSDMFNDNRDDSVLKNLIEKIFVFSQAQENPNFWLNKLKLPEEGFVGEITETIWGSYFNDEFNRLKKELLEAAEIIERADENADNEKYIHKAAVFYVGFAEKLERLEKWDEITNIINEYKGEKHPRSAHKNWLKAEVYPDDLVDEAEAARARCKTIIEEMFEMPQRISASEWQKQIKEQVPLMAGLVDITLEFSKRFKKAKQKEGLLDFNDLEHNCLALLTSEIKEDGTRVPSKVALELQEHFKEIMIDEYQDTNGVQEAIVNLVSKKDNRFYVGDVKQSIYGFRMADPSLFIEKYNAFGHDVNDVERRIDLSQNFRSHANVLNGTNYIFSQIMTKEATGLNYGEKEALYVGRNLDDAPEEYVGGPAEIIAIEKPRQSANEKEDELDDLDAIEIEAKEIAHKLLALKEEGKKVQNSDGTFRDMKWSDVAILLRSVTKKGNVMADIMRSFGIPVYVSEKSGYFSSMEVQLLLSLLQIIDNPEQDLPMAAVLRSPLVGIDSNTLGEVRCYSKVLEEYTTLWQEIPAYAEQKQNLKLLNFVEKLENWRTISRRHSVSELIWTIFEETGFVSYVSAMPNGVARRANVLALYQRAKDYEAGNFRGLFRFLRFIEGLQHMGEDLAVASTLGEGDDVVRIMTIHQSKGLEFPIVFLANANKAFNEMDLKNMLLLHKNSVGLKGYFSDLRVSYPSLPWLYVREVLRKEGKAEEQRVLYVALTRAKDKLYIVGVIDSLEGFIKDKIPQAIATKTAALNTSLILSCRSYFQWIILALSRHLEGAIIRNEQGLELSEHEKIPFSESRWKITLVNYRDKDLATNEQEPLDFEEQAQKIDLELPKELEERLNFSYPYENATKTPAKTSVTELKRRFTVLDEEAQDYRELKKTCSETDLNNSKEAENIATDDDEKYLGLADDNENLSKMLPDETFSSLVDADEDSFENMPEEPDFAGGVMADEAMNFADDDEIANVNAKGLTKSVVDKNAISEGLEAEDDDEILEAFAVLPSWEESDVTVNQGAKYGTLMHTAMQHLPVKKYTYALLDDEIDNLVVKNVLTQEEADKLYRKGIYKFFNSDLGKRVAKAEEVHKEWSFSVLLEGNKYYPNLEAGEELFLQGIMDLVFLEDDEWVLVDYKTDRLETPAEFRERYNIQLELYKKALEQITGKKVKEVCIYSFRLLDIVAFCEF